MVLGGRSETVWVWRLLLESQNPSPMVGTDLTVGPSDLLLGSI